MIDAFFESHGEAAFVIRPGAEPLLYPFADLRVLVLHPVRERDVRFDPLPRRGRSDVVVRSEEHTSELQSRSDLVCRLLLEKKKKKKSLETAYGNRSTAPHRQRAVHGSRLVSSHTRTTLLSRSFGAVLWPSLRAGR